MAAPALGCPRRLPHLPRLLLRRRPPGSSPGPVAGPGPGPGPGWAGASLEPPAEESPPAAPAPPPDWLAALRFDNLALRELPVEEPAEAPNAGPVPGGAAAAPVPDPAPRPVPGACFSRVRPTPLRGPRLVALSEPALALLGLAPGAGAGEAEPPAEAEAEAEAGGEAEARRAREAEVALYFSGNALPPGADPAAHCYCGHQFGSFAGQLGDGAAMYLGEVRGPGGRRWELQLKGAGPTPFSRHADGRKVLRSSIREFLCSEAMFHLGIPTTRAGTCVTSESAVIRDVHYDGNPKYEKCAVVLRIASTFLRFGSFEIFKPRDEHTGRQGPSVGRNDIRIRMLDYVIGTFYPEIEEANADDTVRRNAAFFREVTRRTARTVAEWQCVGFCHGVLNTDNMSIVGLTIDYGPFGFMDRYDPDHVCNGSDEVGRYAYSRQPAVCKWNLRKLAEALAPELPLELGMAIVDEEFEAQFDRHYLYKMRKKLGLIHLELEEDAKLVSDLLETMRLTGADFTNAFRLLSSFSVTADPGEEGDLLDRIGEQCASLEEMKVAFKPQMDPRQLSMMLMLEQSNPQLFTLIGTRSSLDKELERVEQQSRLQTITPAELLEGSKALWEQWLEKYRARLEKEVESVGGAESWAEQRVKTMNSNNPKFILRNYIAQNAIEDAENGDFREVRKVAKLLEHPYREEEGPDDGEGTADRSVRGLAYGGKPPHWAAQLCVT